MVDTLQCDSGYISVWNIMKYLLKRLWFVVCHVWDGISSRNRPLWSEIDPSIKFFIKTEITKMTETKDDLNDSKSPILVFCVKTVEFQKLAPLTLVFYFAHFSFLCWNDDSRLIIYSNIAIKNTLNIYFEAKLTTFKALSWKFSFPFKN